MTIDEGDRDAASTAADSLARSSLHYDSFAVSSLAEVLGTLRVRNRRRGSLAAAEGNHHRYGLVGSSPAEAVGTAGSGSLGWALVRNAGCSGTAVAVHVQS